MRKRLLSFVMALAMICGFAGLLPELDLKASAHSYSYDYKYWCQNQSDYSDMRYYGCYVVALSQLIYETNVNRDISFNPDVFMSWEKENGFLNSKFYQTNGRQAPVTYANQRGKNLEYLGDWDCNDEQIWFNINAGYYTVINAVDVNHIYTDVGVNTNNGHWMLIDNTTSKESGTLYAYWGYNNTKSIALSKFTYISVCSVYKAGHIHSYTSTVTTEPTCTKTGVKTFTCTCGDSYTESIPALGHNYSATKVRVKMNSDGYTKHICSRCGDSYNDNTVAKPVLKSDGWYYCAEIPSDLNESDCKVQYKNTYEKIQEESPGADWTNEGAAQDEWVDSGSAYRSLAELETSDSRVLKSWSYFHFCGTNAGNYANYEQSGNYVHEDRVDPSRVYVASEGWDNDGNIPYYILNWNGGSDRVYCQSGVTCDGSYGTHGERAYTWYKEFWYQDRVHILKYRYTKSSGWVSTADSSASSTQVRFKKEHVHSYTSKVTTKPTCTKDGVITYTCSCGDSYTKTAAKLGHDYEEHIVKPTCIAKGYTWYICSRCNDQNVTNIVDPTGHDWSAWTTTKKATCTAAGSKKRTCTVCGEVEAASIAKLGHDYKTTVVKPTCTAKGYTLHKCTRCGDSYKDTYKDATGHSWSKWTTTKKATCTAAGSKKRTCTVCGEVETASIAKLGHNYNATVVKPTCTAKGYTLRKCTRCGDSYKDTYKDTVAHSWSAWTTTKKATCTAAGSKKRTCTVCGETETASIAKLGHNYKATVVKPTCTAKGYTLHKCTRCGDSYKDTYKDTVAHSWSAWTTTKKATCTAAGSKKRTCSVCGETETATIKKLGHNYVKTVVKPTCTKQGYTLHNCSRCGNSYKDTYKDATGHKWSKWKTTSYNFGKNTSTQTRKCSVCGNSSTQTTKNAVTRFAGANRYETAALISQGMYKNGTDTVIVATGMDYHDALVAVPLAKVYKAPLLLATDQLVTKQTEAELARLKAKKVIIVSTNGAVGNKVKTALKKYNPTMISGSNCYETSVKVAQAMQKKTGKAPSTIFFATGSSFADALSASPVAAIKGAPTLYLKNTGSIDTATANYLKSVKGKVENAYIIGGNGVISNAMMKNVANALGLTVNKTVQRVAGKNRYETCTAVNNKFKSVLTGDGICVAKGLDFPDALAGGVYAAATNQALFLADGKKLLDCQNTYLKGKNAAKITVFGGTGAVPDELVKLIAKSSV